MSGGIQTFPIKPYAKIPIAGDSWLSTPPDELWRQAPEYCNIAVPMGQKIKRGKLAGLDGDSPQTSANLANYLTGLGLDLATVPQVATPTKHGRHFYLATNPPDWFTWAKLAPAQGAGELRVNHCYLLAPVSVLETGIYQFVNGDPGALEFAPFVAWRDLLPLLPAQTDPQGNPTETHRDIQAPVTFPLRLVKREAPARVFQVFDHLQGAAKGAAIPFDDTENSKCYPSRSEAEFGICVLLALAGWEFADVFQEFKTRNPGKFAEKGQGKKYLEKTYRNALAALASDPTRRELTLLHETVKRQPWPGRTGLYDLKTLQAVYAVMWQFANHETRASLRDLAIHTGISFRAVNNALARLTEAEYLELTGEATPQAGRNLRANLHINHKITLNRGDAIPGNPSTAGPFTHAVSELFTSGQYGISAGAVVDCLSSGEALTVATLAARTGKHAGTVRKAVLTLARDGIIFQEGEEKTRGRLAPLYKLAPDKLTEWAEKWGTGVQLERRREKIAEERRRWNGRQPKRKQPAKMPYKAPKTAQDTRGDKTPSVTTPKPTNPPHWALPGNEGAWLAGLVGAYEHKDNYYQVSYETKHYAQDIPQTFDYHPEVYESENLPPF